MPSHQSPDDFAEVNLPTSSPATPVAPEQNYDPTSNSHSPSSVNLEQPEPLHNFPCSWEEFLQLSQPMSGYYDYVDGVVIHQPMRDADDSDLCYSHSKALECSHRNIRGSMSINIQVLSEIKCESTADGDGVSDSLNRGSASTSTQPARQSYDVRNPSFAIVRVKSDSECSSSSSEDSMIKKKIKFYLPYKPEMLAVVEITDESYRDEDLYPKWRTYAHSGVPLYIILDRGTAEYPKQVIVGSLTKFSDAKKSSHGDPDESPNPARSKSGSPSSSAHTYYKKVYKPDDIVDCPYYCKLNKTAKELMNRKFMMRLARKMLNERADNVEIGMQIEAQAKEEERRREEAESSLREEERRREEAASNLKEERRLREEAASSLKEERRLREEAEARIMKAEARIMKAEAELRALKEQAGLSTSSPTNSPVKKKSRK